MEAFKINLKKFQGLAMPNQYSQTVRKHQTGFGIINQGQNPLTFMIPMYSTTVLYDNLDLDNAMHGML